MQDWNMIDQFARPENAGSENDGPNFSQYMHWIVTAYKWTKSPVHCSVEIMKFKYQLEFLVNLSPDKTV